MILDEIILQERANGRRYRRAGDLAEKSQRWNPAFGAESPGAGVTPPTVRVHAMLARWHLSRSDCFCTLLYSKHTFSHHYDVEEFNN